MYALKTYKKHFKSNINRKLIQKHRNIFHLLDCEYKSAKITGVKITGFFFEKLNDL